MSEGKIISVLFIGKKNDFYCEQVMDFVKSHFGEMTVELGKRGESFPGETGWWKGDYIFYYLSPCIIPDFSGYEFRGNQETNPCDQFSRDAGSLCGDCRI